MLLSRKVTQLIYNTVYLYLLFDMKYENSAHDILDKEPFSEFRKEIEWL